MESNRHIFAVLIEGDDLSAGRELCWRCDQIYLLSWYAELLLLSRRLQLELHLHLLVEMGCSLDIVRGLPLRVSRSWGEELLGDREPGVVPLRYFRGLG